MNFGDILGFANEENMSFNKNCQGAHDKVWLLSKRTHLNYT